LTYLYRILCLLGGYICGLLETGVLYGKMKGVDIRKSGSGNTGTTNALRVLGPKAGLIVFLGDFLKSFIPCLVVRFIFKSDYPDSFLLYVLYTGFGAVLGHVFPFYLKFKGGKGVATIAGTIVGLLIPKMILILLVLFVIVVALTKYVSLGSILLMVEFLTLYIIFAFQGWLCFDPDVNSSYKAMIESIVIAALFALLSIARHKTNIRRLLNHEENKLHFKHSEEAKS